MEELSFLDCIEQQTEFVHDALLNYLIAFNKCKCLWCYTEFRSGHCGLFYHCIYIASSRMSTQVPVLPMLCRSLGRAGPLSSFSRTPLSTGPSQMRRTSWTSSVSNTRKWSLHGEKRKVVTQGSAPSFQWFPVRASHTPKKDLQEGTGSGVRQLCSQLPSRLLCPLGVTRNGDKSEGG